MCAMFLILVVFASVKMAFYSVPLALFSRASGLIGTEYTLTRVLPFYREIFCCSIVPTPLRTLCDESAHHERRRCSFSPTPLLNLRGRGAQFRATYSDRNSVSQQSAMMLAENNNRIGYILKSGYRTIATATFDIIGYAYLIAKSVKLQ